MGVLIIAAVLLLPLIIWLIAGSRLDRRRAAAESGSEGFEPWYRRHGRALRFAAGIFVVLGFVSTVVGFTVSCSGNDCGSRFPLWLEIPLIAVSTVFQLALIGGVGWYLTRRARRRLGRREDRGVEPMVLEGQRLRIARRFWIIVFTAAVASSFVYLAGLWTEANRLSHRFAQEIGERFFYSMSTGTALALAGERPAVGELSVPDWYPWLVVSRQALVLAISFGIAWFVYRRSSRNWMAMFMSLFVAVAPFIMFGDGSTDRFESVAGVGGFSALVGDGVAILGFVMFVAFFFVFPDGRFRGTFVRLAISVPLLVAAALFFLGDWGWLLAMIAVGGFVMAAAAAQIFRYQEAAPDERKSARLLLAGLILFPIWVFPGQELYGVVVLPGWGRFVWQQAYLTLYLLTPIAVALGVLYLVRRQGWWDVKLFLGRTAVVAALTPALAIGYVLIALGLTGASGLVFGESSRAVAILIATIAVALAYRPLRARFQSWVDDRWFPSRARAGAAVAELSEGIRGEVDGSTVRDRLVDAVESALGPAAIGVWVPETVEVTP